MNVNHVAVFGYDIHHIDGDHDGDAQLNKLRCQIKIALEVCAVDNV